VAAACPLTHPNFLAISGLGCVNKKDPNLFFVYNFAKNQHILMQSSLLFKKINGICDGVNVTHLT